MVEALAALGSWPVATLLVATRLGALLLMTPLLQAVPVPATIRVLFLLGLSAGIAMGLPAAIGERPMTVGTLIAAFCAEAAVGAALGLGVLAAFAAISIAARLLDVQVGFGIGQVFDPVTHRPVPVLSSLLSTLSVLLFFLLDGHHALLRGLAVSFDHLPLGQGWGGRVAPVHLLHGLSSMFATAFSLAAPVVLCLLLVDLAFGAATRNLPQFNLLVLGTPAKITAGLFVLSMLAGLWSTGVARTQGRMFEDWSKLVSAPAMPRGAR